MSRCESVFVTFTGSAMQCRGEAGHAGKHGSGKREWEAGGAESDAPVACQTWTAACSEPYEVFCPRLGRLFCAKHKHARAEDDCCFVPVEGVSV
jgi:hypothetical protein